MSYSEDDKFAYIRIWNYLIISYVTFIIEITLCMIAMISIGMMVVACEILKLDTLAFAVVEICLASIISICVIAMLYTNSMMKLMDDVRKLGKK